MITWAYIAGFLDGDGWITVSKNKNCLTKRYVIGFTQVNTRRKYIEEIAIWLDNQNIKFTLLDRQAVNSIAGCTFMINIHIKAQPSVVKVLKNLIPYLLIKKDLAEEALRYTEQRLICRGVGKPKIFQDKRQYWNHVEIQQLINLHHLKYSNKAISNELNRSEDSIGHKLYRLKITRKNP